ncbi:MAG: hypothetical protein NW207_01465 [Cytophagales bacterium]|nr:hypothetical protein [Cytophagales bacterium]
MAKSITVLCIIFAMFAHGTFKTCVWGVYILNKKYIATQLCEKRTVQKNSCEGKCHIKKVINNADKAEKKALAGLLNIKIDFFLQHPSYIILPCKLLLSNSMIYPYINTYFFQFMALFIKPPCGK